MTMKRRETRLTESSSPLPSKVEGRSQWRRRRRRRRRKGERSAPSWNESRRRAPPSLFLRGPEVVTPALKQLRKTSGSYCRVNIKKTHKQRTKKRYQNTKQIRGGKRKGYALKRFDSVQHGQASSMSITLSIKLIRF